MQHPWEWAETAVKKQTQIAPVINHTDHQFALAFQADVLRGSSRVPAPLTSMGGYPRS